MAERSAGVARTTSGVRPPEPPAVRWDPGARYRRSLLAGTTTPDDVASRGRDSGGALDEGAGWVLPGRLFRGPALRKPVFDRPVWAPGPPRTRSRDLTARSAVELTDAVERYRRGALNTTGLVRAVGHALAA